MRKGDPMRFAFLPFFTVVIIKGGIMDNDHLCTVQKNVAKVRRSVFYRMSVICMFSGFVSARIQRIQDRKKQVKTGSALSLKKEKESRITKPS